MFLKAILLDTQTLFKFIKSIQPCVKVERRMPDCIKQAGKTVEFSIEDHNS